jgi:hypothetical protein
MGQRSYYGTHVDHGEGILLLEDLSRNAREGSVDQEAYDAHKKHEAAARLSGRANGHCQVLASLKSAEASRALRVAISLGV